MRRATVRSAVDQPTTVARALCPDNTNDVTTTVEDGTVVTTIERDSTGSLAATLDDYVLNLEVATTVVSLADQHRSTHP